MWRKNLDLLWEEKKTFWEKEKMLVTSIFSFPQNIFKASSLVVVKSWDCVVKSKPFPNKPWFLHVCSWSFFENTLEKGEIAPNEQLLLFIRPSKTGRIMGSPVAGGRRPVLCPEHISKITRK